jgi:phosphoglycolate phosphatase-like HAD superfamily hydrolase
MPKFVLFDIDGTLIDAGGVGLRALNRALEDLTGIPDGFSGVDLAGKTDLQIIREALRTLSLPSDNGLEPSLIHSYLDHLRGEMARCKGHLKPGVRHLLPELRQRPDIHLGLLTGNMEDGARLKLGPFGLNEFFPLGAFGGDHEDRNRLLPIAVQRLREQEGIRVRMEECVIIGDTPRDVACALPHGSPCIAVATGRYSVEALREAGANLALPDLSDMDRIVRWIEEI